MTGLLGRLAAQAAGVPPLVRPRLRSRFEPEPGGGESGALEELQHDIDATPPRATAPEAALRAIESPARAREHPDHVAGDRADAPPARRRSAQHAADDRAPRLPAGRIQASAKTADAAVAPSSAGIEASESLRPAPTRPSAAAAAVAARGLTEDIDPTTFEASGSPNRRPLEPSPAGGLLATPRIALAAPPASSAPPAVRTRRDARASEPAPPPPEIHVTIGRIDVRAPASPAPHAPAPAPPSSSPGLGLGLGDYLRQRSDGSRR